MTERLAPYIVILSWMLVPLGLMLCVLAFMAGLHAEYHPNAPHAPYMPYLLPGALAFLLCSLALAIRFTLLRKTGNRARFVKELGGLLLAAAGAGVVLFIVVPPVPASFVQHVGQTPYRVPSAYTSTRDNEPGPRSGLMIVFCLNSWSGYYESLFGWCDRSFIMLSARPLTQHSAVSYLLDHVLKVRHEKGRIPDRAALKDKAPDITDIPRYRWTGYSIGRYHMVVDTDDRLTLVAKCIGTRPYCHIYSDTPRGVLHFEYREGDDFQYANWKTRERRIFELIDSWQEAR